MLGAKMRGRFMLPRSGLTIGVSFACIWRHIADLRLVPLLSFMVATDAFHQFLVFRLFWPILSFFGPKAVRLAGYRTE